MNIARPRGYLTLGLSLLIAIFFHTTLYAQVFHVTNSNDSGSDTLRQAIEQFPSSLIFMHGNPGSSFNIMLNSPIVINNSLSINSSFPAYNTINGTTSQRIFTISETKTVSLDGLTLSNGNVNRKDYSIDQNASRGGAIFTNYQTTLNINNSVFSYNSASAGSSIYNNFQSTLNVQNSTFDHNHGDGGAIYNLGTVTGSNLVFSNNNSGVGGAIENYVAGTVKLTNTVFTNNSAYSNGGAIVNTATLTLTDCVFTSNTSFTRFGGAIANTDGTVTFNISDGKNLSYTGNTAYTSDTANNASGGFLYMSSGSANFNMFGTLSIGDANSISNSNDSIASTNNTPVITKTGSGTLIINSDSSDYHGSFITNKAP